MTEDFDPTVQKKLCIYHGGCEDGFTAAWVVWRALGNAADFHPGRYGEAPPDVTGRDVVIVDFSYKRSVICEMALKAKSILVIDHHKTAEEDLRDFSPDAEWRKGEADNLDITEYPGNVSAMFNMEHSGAALTWGVFFGGVPMPMIVRYTQDRDLWHHALPWTKEVNAWLKSFPHNMQTWTMLAQTLERDPSIAIKEGNAICRVHDKIVDELCALAVKKRIGEYEVPVVNAPWQFASDVGNKICQGQPFAATYIDGPEGRQYSLCSAEDGVDVSEIAQKFGGGGHKHAAGYKVALKKKE